MIPFNQSQHSSNTTIQAYIARMGSHSNYDPVPPYDLDDLESTIPALSNDQLSIDTTTAPTEATERPNVGDAECFDEQKQSKDQQQIRYCSKCNRKFGRLTERERCNYAIVFLILSLTAFCICTSIVVSATIAIHRGKD
jgi:hypothetical protein